MDIRYVLNGIVFVWNEQKAQLNQQKHDGVTFEQAAEVFFDPFVKIVDASREFEAREAAISLFQHSGLHVRSVKSMKFEDLKQRLRRDREMVSVTLEIPADVLEDLERLAPLRGTSDAVALMRSYIGHGLREDLERLTPHKDKIDCVE